MEVLTDLTPLVPLWVIAGLYGFRWISAQARPRRDPGRLQLLAVVLLAISSLIAGGWYFSRSRDFSNPQELQTFLRRHVQPGSSAVGSMVYWPALHDTGFRDFQTPTLRARPHWYVDRVESLEAWFRRARPDFVILDDSWLKWAFELKTQAYRDQKTREELREVLQTGYRLISEARLEPYGNVRILQSR